MCDFKLGDEVVCVDASPAWGTQPCGLKKGETYVILGMGVGFFDDIGIDVGVPSPHFTGMWAPRRFRKAERKNDSLSIEAFLTIKPWQFEEPKRSPEKHREPA